MIAENGTILKEAKRFENQITYGDIDIDRLRTQRRRMNTFGCERKQSYRRVSFSLVMEETRLEREFSCMPFVPSGTDEREKRCEEILSIQSMGLKKGMSIPAVEMR